MGWGTEFKTEIYLNRMTFENKGILEDEIEELEQTIERYKRELLMYCSANVRELIPKDWDEEPITFIYNKVNELLSQLEEDTLLLYKLELLLENFDAKNG